MFSAHHFFKKTPQIVFVLLIVLVVAGVYRGVDNFFLYSTTQSVIELPETALKVKTVQAQVAGTSSAAVKQASPSAAITVQHWGWSVSVPILIYHYIGLNPNPSDKMRDNLSVHPDIFDDQMNVLKINGYTPISLDTFYAGLKGTASLPPKPIVLTFDDGYIDFYANAYPILKKYNFQATSFIPPALMDQGYYLHWDQIKEMEASGLISFQAHSINHVNLVSIPQDQVLHQLVASKKTLEEKLGKPVNFMAYPYGVSNAYTWEMAKQAGYMAALGTWYGTIQSEGTLFNLPRVKVAGNWTKEIFGQHFP